MAWTLDRLRRLVRRIPPTELIPSQQAIVRSYAWNLGTTLVTAAAFTILVSPLGSQDPAVATIPAFALAWIVGFLALPVPAGVGIREGMLIATLSTGAAILIAASIFHRLVSMVGEVAMVAYAWTRRQRDDAEREPLRGSP